MADVERVVEADGTAVREGHLHPRGRGPVPPPIHGVVFGGVAEDERRVPENAYAAAVERGDLSVGRARGADDASGGGWAAAVHYVQTHVVELLPRHPEGQLHNRNGLEIKGGRNIDDQEWRRSGVGPLAVCDLNAHEPGVVIPPDVFDRRTAGPDSIPQTIILEVPPEE